MPGETGSATNQPTYAGVHAEKLGRVGMVKLRGLRLQADAPPEGDEPAMVPVQQCLCLHDSPSTPCTCDGPVVWIPAANVTRRVETGRTDREGRALSEFWMSPHTQLVVESLTPTSAEAVTGVSPGTPSVATRTRLPRPPGAPSAPGGTTVSPGTSDGTVVAYSLKGKVAEAVIGYVVTKVIDGVLEAVGDALGGGYEGDPFEGHPAREPAQDGGGHIPQF